MSNKKPNHHKKAQTEILGLAIIVVFIAIGMLFVIKFSLNKSDEGPREQFINSELASNILNSMIDTHTSCRNLDFSALLKDCAENNPGKIRCTKSSYCVNPNDSSCSINNQNQQVYSCEFITDEINQTLINFMSLMGNNRNYLFTATLAEEEIISLANGECTVWESAYQPLPTYKGALNLRFQMCK
ncbi:MAG: hypothetical protein KAQ83_03830 [Nanoarchaeota archaeon]|nr:hypothetical protein [Nanoarchaeota archaeon]